MKFPVTQRFWTWITRPLLLAGLVLTIPAFYLLLAGLDPAARAAGHALYGCAAILMGIDTWRQWQRYQYGRQTRKSGKLILDLLVIAACLLSVIPGDANWSIWEWLLRLGFCAAVLLRLATLCCNISSPVIWCK